MSDEQRREDELVSAYLDGEATPAEIAEVEQDDARLARVEQLRSVRDAVAAPVAPMPAGLRDQMIGAALAAADAESPQRQAARIVPIHRRHRTLLTAAAATILLAAIVSAGLIASRGNNESTEMAAEAPAATDDASTAAADMAAAEAAPMVEEEPMAAEEAMAATTTAAYVEMAEEEPMAEGEAAIAGADAVDEAEIVELDAAMAAAEAAMAPAEAAAAEAESAMEAFTEESTDAPTAAAEAGREGEDERRALDDAAQQVVDLGPFESLQSLFDNIAARWSAALEDGVMADSGMCAAAVQETALELSIEAGQPFVARVIAEDPLRFDAQLARRADGTAIIIYATPPDCETGTYEQSDSGGS